jgi:hypothetical protein
MPVITPSSASAAMAMRGPVPRDPAESQRVMKAMLQMVKLDVSGLQQAANES